MNFYNGRTFPRFRFRISPSEILEARNVFAEVIGETPTLNSKEIPTLMASVMVQVKEELVSELIAEIPSMCMHSQKMHLLRKKNT